MQRINFDETILEWRKSHFSNPSGNCLEVAEHGGQLVVDGFVHVRDSKNPQGPRLHFTPEEWRAFISGAKNGEFDLTSS